MRKEKYPLFMQTQLTESQLATLINEAFKKSKPYLVDIESAIKQVDNGIISFDVRLFQGKVTDVVITKESRRLTYKG